MAKTNSLDGMRLGERFDAVRNQLLREEYADRLAKPLEYWVLPSDRRLPLALLNRTLEQLLTTPFSELSATPGIGHKKISSLVKLLDRATRDEPPLVSVGHDSGRPGRNVGRTRSSVDLTVFDPSIVSEALWSEWRQFVAQFGIDDQPLGRLAPSLQRLPTVIWHTPIGSYLDHSVAEIRRLRTHGEKRVRCVLEVFHTVYHQLQALLSQNRSSSDSTPASCLPDSCSDVVSPVDADGDRRALLGYTREQLLQGLTMPPVQTVQAWAAHWRSQSSLPTRADVTAGFVQPMMEVIGTDCGSIVGELVSERLGLDGPPRTVREQATVREVSRARIYQLLDDCGKVLEIRWPNGCAVITDLADHFNAISVDAPALAQFRLLTEFCFSPRGSESEFDSPHTFERSFPRDASDMLAAAPDAPPPSHPRETLVVAVDGRHATETVLAGNSLVRSPATKRTVRPK